MVYSVYKMIADDWEQVRSIYLEGIATGNATFEAEAPGWDRWNSGHMQECRLVASAGGTILGWTALSPVSGWCVYSGVAEVSVYVAKKYQRLENKGAASQLFTIVSHVGMCSDQGRKPPIIS